MILIINSIRGAEVEWISEEEEKKEDGRGEGDEGAVSGVPALVPPEAGGSGVGGRAEERRRSGGLAGAQSIQHRRLCAVHAFGCELLHFISSYLH